MRLSSATALGLSLGVLGPASWAQQAPAAEPQPAVLEAVTVRGTAERSVTAKEAPVGVLGDLPLIETPFSINVITRTLIDKQQAAFLGDFLKNDPSAVVGNVAVPFATLRGFSIGTDGQLFDGLPGHGGLSDGRAGLQSIDRIDVLKGASAFLYGLGASTSLGGTLNYLPKRPTDTPLRSVGVGIANRSLYSVDADLGDRFGAERQFGYRVNIGQRDGEQAVQHYDWTQKQGSLALDWRVTRSLVLNLSLEYVENNNPRLPPFFFLGAPGLAVPEPPDTRRSVALSWDDFKTRNAMQYLRADWSFAPDWTLTAQALRNSNARPRTKEARFGSIDDADGNVTLFGSEDESKNRTDSGQLLVQGKFATGALKHRISFGLSGQRDEGSGGFEFLGVFPTNLYQPVDSPEPASALGDIATTSRSRASSVLVSDIVDFSERWSALVGLRRARLKIENIGVDTNSVTKTLPTAALMFKPRPGSLLYVNYAEGLEPGGAVSPTNQNQFLPPISTEQVEIGSKFEWDALSFTAVAFDMRRPLESFDASVGQNVQRGRQRHRGIELVLNGRLTPALTVVAGTMLLDADVQASGDPATEGKRPVGVPRLTANLWGEYRIAALQGVAVSGGVFHVGKQYLDGANTQAVKAWTRLDLGASWETRIADRNVALLLNVENATDRRYWASAQSGILTIADPRTVKLGARLGF